MKRHDRQALLRLAVVALPSLIVATVGVALLQDGLGVPNPSALYLVAVVATALASGTVGAIATSVAAFVLYNFLFTEPRYTLSMHEPGVWLSVVLLLFVGVVVGQLAAVVRARADAAEAREREAKALFRVSRALATRTTTNTALSEIAAILSAESKMTDVWVALGVEPNERVVAGTTADPPPRQRLTNVLRRTPGDEPATWIRLHQAGERQIGSGEDDLYRVHAQAGGEVLGSILAARIRQLGPLGQAETRLISAAADQVGQALAQDRFAADSQTAELARQSDALKSALLQSVSHDLRTPLATIRAAAGSIAADGLDPEARRESAEAIDREAEYLNRIVSNLLDLSRIEAGVLHPEKEAFELDDVISAALERLRPRSGARPIGVDLGGRTVVADPLMVDQIFTNLLENALRHTPGGIPIHVSAGDVDADTVRLTIEDGGPGVPAGSIDHLFDKFYRAPGRPGSSREGTGVGLAVVRGLVEAMGGEVHARPSEIGGLAIDVDLPRAPMESRP
jgi:two-component system sensor histidine kinase KdpD